MKKSKKKGRPKQPTSHGKQIQLRLHDDALEKCKGIVRHMQANGHSEVTTRSAAIRKMINDYFLPQSYQ